MSKAVKGIDHVVVMVDGIDAAQKAYEKLGFRRVGTTKESNGVLYNPMEYGSAG